jgi:hypothetical protein
MKIVKWFEKEEEMTKVSPIEQFLKKFDSNSLDPTKDNVLFYMAMSEATLRSQETDDEDKKELWEEMADDIEEYQSLAYFTEIRGVDDQKTVMVLTPEEQKFGLWEGAYDAGEAREIAAGVKNITYMEMLPKTALKIMTGDPNTDADYMKGDLTVKGTINLAVKPRNWIAMFFEFCDRDVE